MSLTITAITTDATEPVHTHLRNLPTGTVAIFAPRTDASTLEIKRTHTTTQEKTDVRRMYARNRQH